MTENTQERKGLLNSLATLAATLVAIAHTRLDLLSNDLEEDREHLLSILAWSLAALFFLGVGVLLATFLLVAAYWETHRLLVLGSLVGLFFILGMTAVWRAMHKAKTKPKLFAASLLELFKDRQQLDSNG